MSDDLKDAVLAAFGDDDNNKPATEETGEGTVAETPKSAAIPTAAPTGKVSKTPRSRGKSSLSTPRVAATQASRVAPQAPAAGATTARPPVTAASSAPARPAIAAPAVAPVRNNSSNMILILLLLINLALVVLCGGLLARINSLNARLITIETKVAQTFQAADRSSKIHAGVSYLGPNKRPQKYMMVIKYDEKGNPQFEQEAFRPVEE